MKKRYILAILLATLAGSILAQTPFHYRYSTREGLIQYSVSTIIQDQAGYLWFGTESGISRFDGRAFHNFANNNGFVNDTVRTIVGSGSTVFALSGQGNLFAYRQGQMTEVPILAPAQYAFAGHLQPLWLLTNQGLTTIDGKQSFVVPEIVREAREQPINICYLGNRIILALGRNLWDFDELSSPRVISTWPDPILDLVCTEDNKLVLVFATRISILPGGANATAITLPAPENLHFTCASTQGSKIALGTTSGHLVFREERQWKVLKSGMPDNAVMSICYDTEGNLWLGLDSAGVLLLPQTKFTSFTAEDGVGTGDAFFIQADRLRGGVWVGTRNGGAAHIAPGGIVTSLRKPGELPSNQVRALTQTPDGTVWIGTLDGVVCIPATGHMAILPGTRGLGWCSFFFEEPNTLWIGSTEGHLLSCNILTRKTKITLYLPVRTQIRRILRHKDQLWLATLQGLFQWNGRLLATVSELEGAEVRSLLAEPGGSLLVITISRGLWQFSGGTRRVIYRPAGRTVRLYDGMFGPDNRLYVAADNGLHIWNRQNWTHLDTRHGLNSDVIYLLGFDRLGQCWVGSNLGLNVLKGDRVQASFDYRDGLADNETNGFGFTLDELGHAWFCTMGGVSVIDPTQIRRNDLPPRLAIERIEVNGKTRIANPVSSGEYPTLQLANNENSLKFFFSTLTFTNPTRIRFQNMLEGFDPDWNPPTTEPLSSYPRLPPGEYRFRLRCDRGDDNWSAVLSVPLNIRPAMWQKTWFKILLGWIAFMAVYFFFYLRLRTVRRQKRHLEDLVNERTRELAKANHELIQLSITDSLTGLFNRRFFQQKVQEDMALAIRHYMPGIDKPSISPDLGFFMVDIDHFKALNDQLGHEAGDQLLRQISDRFRQTVRLSDTLVRWGGEEFLILAKESNPDNSSQLAERLLRVISDTPFEVGGVHVTKTISIGFCTFPFVAKNPSQLGWEHLVRISDLALYLAKREGRNRFVGVRCLPADLTPVEQQHILNDLSEAAVAGLVDLIRVRKKRESPNSILHPR